MLTKVRYQLEESELKKKIFAVLLFVTLFAVFAVTAAGAAAFDQVISRWAKEQRFVNKMGNNLTITCTYYSAEYIEASVQSEAQKNLWTQSETDDYKYNLLGALQLSEMIPINIKFINNGPTMHLGPFDIMVKLRIGNKLYKPVDYDKRFNFNFQGEKEGLVYFRRYDEKTGKDLLKGVKSVRLEFNNAISTVLENKEPKFMWEIKDDDPSKLYQGKSAARFETDRLLKRLEKLRKDKAGLEAQMKTVNDEITTIQTRLDELSKK